MTFLFTFTFYNLVAISIYFNESTYNVNEDGGSLQPVIVFSNPSATDIIIRVITDNEGNASSKFAHILRIK